MTEHDEMAVRGQAMTEYVQNKARLAALQEEGRRIGAGLESVGRLLAGAHVELLTVGPNTISYQFQTQRRTEVPIDVFDLQAIGRLVDEMRELLGRQTALKKTLEQMGFPT
jgi:hypothetical protein